MSLHREELLRQKALIQKQLEWVDEKLAECEASEGSQVNQPSERPLSDEVERPIVETESMDSESFSSSHFNGNDPAEGITVGQKFGCLILVIIICAGALATLFVLPYLIY